MRRIFCLIVMASEEIFHCNLALRDAWIFVLDNAVGSYHYEVDWQLAFGFCPESLYLVHEFGVVFLVDCEFCVPKLHFANIDDAVGAGDYEVYLCAVFAFLRLPARHASLYAGYAEGFFYAVDVLQAKLFKGVSRPGVVYCCAELQRPKLLVVEAQVFANEVAIV